MAMSSSQKNLTSEDIFSQGFFEEDKKKDESESQSNFLLNLYGCANFDIDFMSDSQSDLNLELRKIYIEVKESSLEYKIKTPTGIVNGSIEKLLLQERLKDARYALFETALKNHSLEELKPFMNDILVVTQVSPAVYYNSWKMSQDTEGKDSSMVMFRGQLKNDEKPQEGYITNPNLEFIELQRQVRILIGELKKWSQKNKIPSSAEEKGFVNWDRLAVNLFHSSYLNLESAVTIYSQGKELLEKLVFELSRKNINQRTAEVAIGNLYKKLTVCGPGVFTDLQTACAEFSKTPAERFKAARLTVAQQFAVALLPTLERPPPPGMEIHYVNALTNHVAGRINLTVFEDVHIKDCKISKKDYENYLALIQDISFAEQIIEKLIDQYLNDMSMVNTTEEVQNFFKKLDLLGKFNEGPEVYFGIIKKNVVLLDEMKKDRDDSGTLKKSTEQIRQALRRSIFARLTYSNIIINDKNKPFIHILVDEAKCALIPVLSEPKEPMLVELKSPYSYATLESKCDFIVLAKPPGSLMNATLEGEATQAYGIFNNNVFFITKRNPAKKFSKNSFKLILTTDDEDVKPEVYKKNLDNFQTLKEKLNVTDILIDKSNYVVANLDADTMQVIQDTTQHKLPYGLFYLHKAPPEIYRIDIDRLKFNQLTHDCKFTDDLDDQEIEIITKITDHHHKATLNIISESASLSWIQKRVTQPLQLDKELFIDYLRELKVDDQVFIMEQILKTPVSLRFVDQCATSIKLDALDKLIAKKTSEPIFLFLLAIRKNNIAGLRQLLINNNELKGDREQKMSDAEILTQALTLPDVKAIWRQLKTVPVTIKCTSLLFLRSYREGANEDFSNVIFSGMDFKEVKEIELKHIKLNFYGADLREAKNITSLIINNTVNLRKAKLNRNQLQELYNAGWRKFEGVDLRGIDLRGLKIDEANFTEADLRGARMEARQTSYIYKCQFDEVAIQHLIEQGHRYFNYLNLRGLDFSKLKFTNLILFNGSDLSHANLNGFDFKLVCFNSCNLANATAVNANLHNAYCFWVNLSGVDFTGAKGDLIFVPMLEPLAKCPYEKTIFDYKSFHSYMSRNVNKNISEGVMLVGDFATHPLNLQGVTLSRKLVRELYKQGQRSFSGAIINYSDLSFLDLSGAIFFRTNLKKTIFTNTNLIFSSFTEAELSMSVFSNTIFSGLPHDYIKICSSTTSPLLICKKALAKYIQDYNNSYSIFSSHDPYVSALKDAITHFPDFKSVNEVRDFIEKNCKAKIHDSKLLFSIFNLCSLYASQTPNQKQYLEIKEEKDGKEAKPELKREDKSKSANDAVMEPTMRNDMWRESGTLAKLKELLPQVSEWKEGIGGARNQFTKRMLSHDSALELQGALQSLLSKAPEGITVNVVKEGQNSFLILENVTETNLDNLKPMQKQFNQLKIL